MNITLITSPFLNTSSTKGVLRALLWAFLLAALPAIAADEDVFDISNLSSELPASKFINLSDIAEAQTSLIEILTIEFMQEHVIPSTNQLGTAADLAIDWRPNDSDSLMLNSASGLSWFYFNIQNSGDTPKRILFEFNNFDGIGWAEENRLISPRYDSYIGGRQIYDTDFIVPVEIAANSTAKLVGYIYAVSVPRLGNVRAWDPEVFRAQRVQQHFVDGAYYGFIFALVIFNFALAFAMRQIAYLYAGAFQFCIGAMVFLITGYSTLFLIPNNVIFTVPIYGILALLASVTAGLFSNSILQIRYRNLLLYRMWLALIVFNIIQIPLVAVASFPTDISPNGNLMLLALNAGVFLCAQGVHVFTLFYFWNKVSITKYWFVAITLQAWMVMAWSLALVRGIESADLFRYLVQIFSLINSAILTLLVNSTVKEKERYKEAAQLEAFRNLKIANDIQNSKADFISTAGHDLSQPLGAIRLHIEALQETASTTTARVLTKVENNISELSALLNSLMNLAKSTSYIDGNADEEFLLDEVLNGLKDEVQPFTSQKGIELAIEAAPYLVSTNKIGLTQILRNLLNNSVKFTREGRVGVDVEQLNDSILISVVDTGSGIPQEELDRIFDEFYQVESDSDYAANGMGIGLSIVKRLSKALNITLQVESSLTSGTRFSLELPTSTASKIERSLNSDPSSLNGIRVAIVHGSEDRWTELKNILEQWGAMALGWPVLQSLDDYMRKHSWQPHLLIIEQSQFQEGYLNGAAYPGMQVLDSHIIVLSSESVREFDVGTAEKLHTLTELNLSKLHWFKDPIPPGVLRSFIQRMVVKTTN